MKPVDFDYAAPSTIDEVLDLLAKWQGEAKLLAGGQSLVPLLVTRALRPRFVIDINRLPDLDYIRESEGGISIGATARQADVESSPLITAQCPLLREALRWVATPQVRNRGTVVGSLTQRNAISEIPTVALALGARLRVLSRQHEERWVEAETFLDPGHPETLQPTEFVVEAWFPSQGSGTGYAFVECQKRHVHYATVGVAVTLARSAQGVIEEIRVAASGLALHVMRLREVERALEGQPATAENLRLGAARATFEPALNPLNDVHATATYRRDVAPAIVEEALLNAIARIG